MHQTALPSGMQTTTEPHTGVAASDGVSAETAGAAMTPTDRAIAVAATIFVILLDICTSFDSSEFISAYGFHSSPIVR
jgi:hypothetical protein